MRCGVGVTEATTARGRPVVPGNGPYPNIAAQNRDNSKDDKWPRRRAGGILTVSSAEDHEEHADNTNTGGDVDGDGNVPSKVGMDVKHHGTGGGLVLLVCFRMMTAATSKLSAALAAAMNATRYTFG